MIGRAPLWAVVVVVLLGLSIAATRGPGPQAGAGPLATWADGETWSRYLAATGETEVGLGLQPSGSGGTMKVAFMARQRGKTAPRAPEEITVQLGSGALVNPNILRSPTLVFVLNPKTAQQVTLDLSSRLSVDNPAPGAAVTSGFARIPSAAFVRITRARRLSAMTLGLSVEFSPAQLEALRAFRDRLSLR